jgi:hypothetical protein
MRGSWSGMRDTPGRISGHGTRITLVGLLVVLGLSMFAGVSVSHHPLLALATSLMVLGLGVMFYRSRLGRSMGRRFAWIPWAWIALAYFADHRMTESYRSPLAAASGELSLQNGIQLVVYAFVGVLVLYHRGALIRGSRIPILRDYVFVLLWPSIALLSAIWSIIPRFTVARALQLFVVISLGLLCARIWLLWPDLARALLIRTLRLFVVLTALLALSGFAFNEGWSIRFEWFGANAIIAATYVAAALLILVLGGRSLTGFVLPIYSSLLLLFGVVIYLTRTRSVLVALSLSISLGVRAVRPWPASTAGSLFGPLRFMSSAWPVDGHLVSDTDRPGPSSPRKWTGGPAPRTTPGWNSCLESALWGASSLLRASRSSFSASIEPNGSILSIDSRSESLSSCWWLQAHHPKRSRFLGWVSCFSSSSHRS